MVESAFPLPVNTNAEPLIFSLLTPEALLEVFVELLLLELEALVLLDVFDLVSFPVELVLLVELLLFALVPLVPLVPLVELLLVPLVEFDDDDDDDAFAEEDVVAYFPLFFPPNLDPYN